MKPETPAWRRALCCLLLPFALAAAKPPSHRGHGVLLELREHGQVLLIRHQAIPGFMPAMTMTFELSDPKLARGLKPGQAVEFTLTKHGNFWPITALRPAPGPTAQPTAPPR